MTIPLKDFRRRRYDAAAVAPVVALPPFSTSDERQKLCPFSVKTESRLSNLFKNDLGSTGEIIDLKPTEDEAAALAAIQRLGEHIDKSLAIEFLRGSTFGDVSGYGSSSGTSGSSERGLPATAVGILKLWFLKHQDNPYPNKSERVKLLDETCLTPMQLKNWFSNIRKRHWHPIRTGSRRPRSHVEYVLLMGAANSKARARIDTQTSVETISPPFCVDAMRHAESFQDAGLVTLEKRRKIVKNPKFEDDSTVDEDYDEEIDSSSDF